jgi:hypothetical protein
MELLNRLIEENATAEIVVMTAQDPAHIKNNLENKEIKVLQDRELVQNKELECDIVIGFDMPIKNIVYMARAGKAKEKSFMLLDESEQKDLHFIEMLLGRAMKQEVVEGFGYPEKSEAPKEPKAKKLSKDEIKEVAKKRFEKSTQEKPAFDAKKKFDKPKKEFKKSDKPKDERWAKKKKAPNKFLGKDENGKAIFSGKSGERNHRYDGTPRDKYDAPKTTGKKINIKARKTKSED